IAGVGDALDVEAPEGVSSGSRRVLLEHRDGSARVLFIEDERPSALVGEQAREAIARGEERDEADPDHERGGDENRARPAALEDGESAERRPTESEQAQRANEAEAGDEDKTSEESPGDPP